MGSCTSDACELSLSRHSTCTARWRNHNSNGNSSSNYECQTSPTASKAAVAASTVITTTQRRQPRQQQQQQLRTNYNAINITNKNSGSSNDRSGVESPCTRLRGVDGSHLSRANSLVQCQRDGPCGSISVLLKVRDDLPKHHPQAAGNDRR